MTQSESLNPQPFSKGSLDLRLNCCSGLHLCCFVLNKTGELAEVRGVEGVLLAASCVFV